MEGYCRRNSLRSMEGCCCNNSFGITIVTLFFSKMKKSNEHVLYFFVFIESEKGLICKVVLCVVKHSVLIILVTSL